MKAACVLACLALATGISASIFKQQERRVEGLDVLQPILNNKYINEPLGLLDSIKSVGQNLLDNTLGNKKTQEEQLQQDLRNWNVQLQEQLRQQTSKLQEQLPEIIQYQKPSVPLQYQQPSLPLQYQQPSLPLQYQQPSLPLKYQQPSLPVQYQQQSQRVPRHQQPLQKPQDWHSTHEKPSQKPQEPQDWHSTHQKPSQKPQEPQEWHSTHQKPSQKPQEWHSTHQQPSQKPQEWHSTHQKPQNPQEWHTSHEQPSLNSQEWHSTHHHQSHLHNHDHQHDHHHHHNNKPRLALESSSSSESSEESQEWTNQAKEVQQIRAQRWTQPRLPLVDSIMNQNNQNVQSNGNVIGLNGLKMTVGPKSLVQGVEDIEKIFGDVEKAMKHIQVEDKIKIREVFEIAQQTENEDVVLNATQLAQKYEYTIEEHTVKTDDGYILTVFRIPPKMRTRDVQKRPVVFLMHGVLGSADDWLLMGPGKSLAYLLADAGYDVWLGNARGNKYSRRHVSKHPAMSDFWQFSNDEIALHDLPAMIDLALETAQQEKLYYVGVAQGTTSFFALTATRPEYNNKIIMMYALSPMVYMTNVRSPLLRMMAPTNKFQERLNRQIGNEAFTLNKELIDTVGGVMCEIMIGNEKLCSNVNFIMSGLNVDSMDPRILPVVMGHLPSTTSAKVMKQYGQGVASNEFRRYDYGPYINWQVYGSEEPPKYNIAEVQVPVTLYYSEEDWLANPEDVARLQKELPNVREAVKVPEEHFSHMDFQFSTKAPEMVYQQLIQSMKQQQQQQ
ncbi:unnamed protein product [Spodoptera littoralis]|uniref:Partial AB-hydrolase lipase domain-containing protein n=1 Tax=Spodoptera littoralis TaxID=7109 RepID=A0A9P0N2W8_SPOLI|nr:unnamed protein product [Spodoptera littoralis]CAH1640477.1 unnamed protein product [Spodoptera littoralis]